MKKIMPTILLVLLMNYSNAQLKVFDNGRTILGDLNTIPLEKFQIGKKWTFHNGGAKFIGYNVFWASNSGDKRIYTGSASQIRFEENRLRFLVAPSGSSGSSFNPSNGLTIDANGKIMVYGNIYSEKNGHILRFLPSNPEPEIGSSTNRINFWYTSVGWNVLYAKSYVKASDRRLKSNIKLIDGALKKISSLKGVNFNYKKSGDFSYGLIAQDVEKVLPELVTETKDIKAVDYDALIPLLIEAIKEQQKEIEQLKEQMKSLKNK